MAKKIPKNHVPPPVQKKKKFYKIAKNARSNDFHAVLTQKFFLKKKIGTGRGARGADKMQPPLISLYVKLKISQK